MKILNKNDIFVIEKINKKNGQLEEEELNINEVYIYRHNSRYEIGRLVNVNNNQIIFDCSNLRKSIVNSYKLDEIDFITLKYIN